MALLPKKSLVLLLSFLVSATSAWNVAKSTNPKSPTLPRRLLVQAPLAVASGLVVSLTTATTASAATMATPDAAKAQWKAAVTTIDRLLDDWDAYVARGGGDAIRTALGTQGITSPLFQIDKALRVLRDDAEDIVEFTEQTDEFLLTLSRADSMAYSANFAGGSGKPTPPAVYIERSRKEVVDLQRLARALSSQLP